jgi:hypothetical protein
MRNNHDRRAKDLLDVLLRAMVPSLSIKDEAPVSTAPQSIDLLVKVEPSLRPELEKIPGLLGRMLRHTCLFEPFSRAPGVKEVTDCVRKSLTFQHANTNTPNLVESQCWVLASGDPLQARQHWQMRRVRGWPDGVYRAAPASGVWLVVLSQLPRTYDTLAVRLLGRGKVLQDAIVDVQSLPLDDMLRQPIDGLLVRLQIELKNAGKESALMNRINRLEEQYQAHVKQIREQGFERGRAEGLERGRAQGLEQGRAETLRSALIDLCEIFAIELTDARRAYIASLDLPGLEALRVQLKQHRAWPAS